MYNTHKFINVYYIRIILIKISYNRALISEPVRSGTSLENWTDENLNECLCTLYADL